MMLTLSRPALITSSPGRLDTEYRSARWIHHRLLDFEFLHQKVLDEAAEACAPGITRIGRILSRLARRARWAERASPGSWRPNPRPDLVKRLRVLLAAARKQRNADPRWKAACGWANEPVGDPKQVRRRRAKAPDKVRRRKTETDEAFRKRFERDTTDETDDHYAAKVAAAPKRTRREQFRCELYDQRSIYHGTWNALCKSVDQALADVLKRRTKGLPAELRRPRFRDPISLASEDGGVKIIDRGSPWWVLQLRLGIEEGKDAEWVTLRAKCGNWHKLGAGTAIKTAKLTRRRDGERWTYSINLAIDGVKKADHGEATQGAVALDWGHREHGHDAEHQGIRVFTWVGGDENGYEDGAKGEVLIPVECRKALDEIDAMKGRLDAAFDRRRVTYKLPERNRYGYRKRLMLSGVRTAEERDWLRWEMRYERRIHKRRKRIANLRREVYLRAVRELRQRYATFVFEGERIHDSDGGPSIRKLQTEDMMRHRARANRDLAARYEFVTICERLGAAMETVPARNTTRECPEPGCDGLLDENGPELVVVCPKCGTARDKDYGAARVILQRWRATLANPPPSIENDKAAE